MRIISGTHKGKSIVAPNNLPVRPTTDFAKEALFNILENNFYLDDVEVLDLFSGTGNISYEFASRGAKLINSVDQNFNCYNFLKKTSNNLKLTAINPFKADVFKFLKNHPKQYDVIFADPPYDLKNIDEIALLVFQFNTLKEQGWLIIEHDKRTNLSTLPHFSSIRKYGNVHFSVFMINQ